MNDILKMNDRPTPETDAFSVKFKSVCGSKAWVPTDICRRFERERDEAREALEFRRGLYKVQEEYLEKARRERDEARDAEQNWRITASSLRVECDELLEENKWLAWDQSRWKSTKVELPTAGEWVLHTYKGVRAPEYGIYERGHFFRGGGPESFPATHWLRVPNISCVKCGETLRGDEDESETHCKWCVQGWESATSDSTEAAK